MRGKRCFHQNAEVSRLWPRGEWLSRQALQATVMWLQVTLNHTVPPVEQEAISGDEFGWNVFLSLLSILQWELIQLRLDHSPAEGEGNNDALNALLMGPVCVGLWGVAAEWVLTSTPAVYYCWLHTLSSVIELIGVACKISRMQWPFKGHCSILCEAHFNKAAESVFLPCFPALFKWSRKCPAGEHRWESHYASWGLTEALWENSSIWGRPGEKKHSQLITTRSQHGWLNPNQPLNTVDFRPCNL